jgi:hypothetical protein
MHFGARSLRRINSAAFVYGPGLRIRRAQLKDAAPEQRAALLALLTVLVQELTR